MARVFLIEGADGTSKSIALVDLLCAGYEPFAVLEQDHLTVILYDSIIRIDPATGMIRQCVECGSWGGLYEIHPIPGGYIIWGECDIFRYDLALNRVWHFMGRDILVSSKMDRHFWMEEDLIHCRDFEGWHYVLDLNGNLIHDFREVHDDDGSAEPQEKSC